VQRLCGLFSGTTLNRTVRGAEATLCSEVVELRRPTDGGRDIEGGRDMGGSEDARVEGGSIGGSEDARVGGGNRVLMELLLGGRTWGTEGAAGSKACGGVPASQSSMAAANSGLSTEAAWPKVRT